MRFNLTSNLGLTLVLLVALGWGAWDWWGSRDIRYWISRYPAEGRGAVLAAQVAREALEPEGVATLRARLGPRMSGHGAPVQENLPRRVPGWERRGFEFIPRAAYGVEARVLATQTYDDDHLAPVAPIDHALGWGPMSDPRVTDPLGVSIHRRFYRYGWRGEPPLPEAVMTRSSANKHLIPATPEVEEALRRAGRHDWIRIYGYLVDIRIPDGFVARTSRVRTDRGAGACENIWVVAVDFPEGPAPLPPGVPRTR